MHILVVSEFFYPEMGAPAARFADLGHAFVAAGHEVTVLTTWPNFPQGKLYQGHKQHLWAEEWVRGVRVLRTPILALGGHTPLRKAMLYATFATSSLLQGLAQALAGRLRPDVIIGTTPPPTVAYASLVLAQLLNVPHVLDIRDIWPEAVVLSGRVQPGLAVRALETLNAVALQRSAAVTTVSQGKQVRLLELGARPGSVHVLPNGVDLAYFDHEAAENAQAAAAWLRSVGVPDGKRLVLYTGVFNPPQGLDGLLDAAKGRQTLPEDDLHFVLVGDGSLRGHLQRRVTAEALTNVTIAGPVPRTQVASLVGAAWATVVILRPRKDSHTVPSKLYEAMASGRPVLVSADGEVTAIAAAAGCGPVSAAGDVAGLLAGLTALAADPQAAEAMGQSGRRYVEQYNDRAVLAGRYLQLLQDAVAAASSRGAV
jgi:colanic acid biosynthesis glycosyl transferase WcaI